MLKRIGRLNIFLRISLLFVLTTLIAISLIGYLANRYYTKFLTAEIASSNAHLLGNVQNTVDNMFFVAAEVLSYDLQTTTYRDPDLFYLLEYPVKENPEYILPVRSILNNIVARRAPYIHSVSVYFKENNLIVSSMSGVKYLDSSSVPVPFDTEWTRLFADESRGRNSIWLGPREHPPITVGSDGDRIITYVRTIPLVSSAENSTGLLAINVYETEIRKELKKAVMHTGAIILITDSDGNIISHSSSTKVKTDISNDPFWRRIKAQTQEGFIADFDGTANVFVVSQSPHSGRYYIYAEPAADFYKPVAVITNIVLFICSAALLISIILATSVTGRILAPLKPLVALSADLLKAQGKMTGQVGGLALVGDALKILNATSLNLRELLDINREKIEHSFFFDLLHDRIHQKQEIIERLEFLESDFPHSLFTAVIVQFDVRAMDKLRIEQSEYLLHSLIQKSRLEMEGTVAIVEDRYRVNLVGNHPQESSVYITGVIDSITTLAREVFGLECQFGIGMPVHDITQISGSYREAHAAIAYASIHEKVKVLNFQSTSAWDANHTPRIKVLEKLPELIRSRNGSKSKTALESIKQSIIEKHGSYQEYLRVVDRISRIVEEIAHDLHSGEILPPHTKDSRGTGGYYYIDDVFTYLNVKIENLISVLDEKRDTQTVLYVANAKQFIGEHLSQDLSLDLVADTLGISVTYLSRIFKNVSNEGFLKYVTRIRMEKAALLLKERGAKAGEISLQVGYHDYSYFSLTFKKYYGITPGKYGKEPVSI